MNIHASIKKVEGKLANNSDSILSGLGVVGVFTTAFLASKATLKAERILDDHEQARLQESNGETPSPPDWKHKVRLVWSCYIPAAASALGTTVAIIWSNRLNTKRVAALAAAYSISERAFQEYKEKVVEKFGENKARQVKDELAQRRIDENPIQKEVIIAGSGDVLCFDILSGRYFMSSVEEIRATENKANAFILQHMYISLSSFYDDLGLDANGFSDTVGFNTDNLVEIDFSTTMSSDGRPCITIEFVNQPIAFYNNLY